MSRRERRRQETIDEILDLSLEVMQQDGVTGLNLTTVAKRLGVQPTALYKYFPSLVAVYDALYRRAMNSFVRTLETALEGAPPGMGTIREAIQASSRWASDNPELAQLLIWRPVPGYTPPADAIANAAWLMDSMHNALSAAADAGEISPDIAGGRGLHIFGVLLTGAVTMHLADYGAVYSPGEFIDLVPDLIDMFVSAFSPQNTGKT